MAALEVAGHLSATELGRRYRTSRGRVERGPSRWSGSSSRGAAAARWPGSWAPAGSGWPRSCGAATRRGRDGPDDRRRRNVGAKPLLGAEDEAALRAALAEPPADGGLWTGPKVATWMAARLGREVWPQRGWDYLRKLGHSAQVPRPRHAKAAGPEEQAAYKKSWPPRWTSTARRSPGGRSRWGRSTSTGSG